ncbi:MAG: hypothetical protein ACRCV3_03650 [Desulfovibrionaceae bacterium]
MQSEISICNIALGYLGIDPISSFEEDRKESRLLADIYVRARNELLERFDFSFSTRIERLARKKSSLVPGYSFVYQLPIYCLRLRNVYSTRKYLLGENKTIYSSSEEMVVEMSSIITDTSVFSYLFTEALSCRVVSMIASALTGDIKKSEVFYRKYTEIFYEAQKQDPFLFPESEAEQSSWLMIRN